MTLVRGSRDGFAAGVLLAVLSLPCLIVGRGSRDGFAPMILLGGFALLRASLTVEGGPMQCKGGE